MKFFFSRIVILLHLYICLLTVIAALPATQITMAHDTDAKETETSVEVNTAEIENAGSQLLNSFSGESLRRFLKGREIKAELDGFRGCEILNHTFQHREQIPRSDPCEICVCIDSEMYCFWKPCTFTKSTSIATSTVSPNSSSNPSIDEPSNSTNTENVTKLNESSKEIVDTTNEKYSKILMDQRKYNVLKKLEATSPKNLMTSQRATTDKVSTESTEQIVCYVMGVMYKYGEVLPKDTGTCLKCSCSDGGRVTCSPKDCVSQPDLDYLSHDNNMDLFDIDTF